MIHVIAQIDLKPGTRDDFLREFHRIVPLVRKEAGCLDYGPTIDAETDIENQDRNPQRVIIIERWESVEHLKAHLSAPHMVAYRPKVKPFIAGATLYVLQPS